jgi:opacity protein-like surface antigen
LKFKLILVTVLAFGCMAHAQGILSNLSVDAGLQGIFPASTFDKSAAEFSATSATTQATTNSVGAVFGARYDFGRHSAFDAAVTINRNSELFENANQFLARVQTNNTEFIGTYIFRLPSNAHIKPFSLVGGGMVHFSPNNDYSPQNSIPSSETKPAFAYGFGSDFPVSDHFSIRVQYRGLIRGEPDFKLSGVFGTGLKTHVAEPSIQVVYHF